MEVINTMEKTRGELLAEELTWEFPNIAKEAPEQREVCGDVLCRLQSISG